MTPEGVLADVPCGRCLPQLRCDKKSPQGPEDVALANALREPCPAPYRERYSLLSIDTSGAHSLVFRVAPDLVTGTGC